MGKMSIDYCKCPGCVAGPGIAFETRVSAAAWGKGGRRTCVGRGRIQAPDACCAGCPAAPGAAALAPSGCGSPGPGIVAARRSPPRQAYGPRILAGRLAKYLLSLGPASKGEPMSQQTDSATFKGGGHGGAARYGVSGSTL